MLSLVCKNVNFCRINPFRCWLCLIKIFNSFSDIVFYALNNSVSCPQNCGKSYKLISSLNKHLKYECNISPQYKCQFCEKMCKRPDNLRSHMRRVHKYNDSKYQYNILDNCLDIKVFPGLQYRYN